MYGWRTKMGHGSDIEMGRRLIAERLYEKAPEADGIFIPCPCWPTIAMCKSWSKRSASR